MPRLTKDHFSEFFDVRLKANGIEFTILHETVHGTWITKARTQKTINKHKDLVKYLGDSEHHIHLGSIYNVREVSFVTHPVTKLEVCDMCGKMSVPKKVQYRCVESLWTMIDISGKHDYTKAKDAPHILCMGCWNKLRHLADLQFETVKLNKTLRKLKCQKSKQPAN